MSTLQSSPSVALRGRTKARIIIAALSGAIVVAVLVVVLAGTSPRGHVAQNGSSAYYPLVHYHGTGAAPVVGPGTATATNGLPLVHYHGTGAAPVTAGASASHSYTRGPATPTVLHFLGAQ